MAINIQQKFGIDLSGVVENSITAVRAIRKNEQIRKESEFQKAIAGGMSYESQIEFRRNQLKNEKESAIPDPNFITDLENSISDVVKLNRYNKYRTKYATALTELNAGKINEEKYATELKNQLTGIDDPELRLEIQKDIATGERLAKTYTDTILRNQVIKAENDKTQSSLRSAIDKVTSAKTNAIINDKQDEVTAYDETLTALNSQLFVVGVQDTITDFQVKSATKIVTPIEKLDLINREFDKSDISTNIRLGDRTYASTKEFWTIERDNFLSGKSEAFGSFFTEMDSYLKDTVDANSKKFGHPTEDVVVSIDTVFNSLKTRPEFIPFLEKLDISRTVAMEDAVSRIAKSVVDIGTQNFDFWSSNEQLVGLENRFGISTESSKLLLRNANLSSHVELLKRFGEAGAINRSIETALPPPTTGLESAETRAAKGIIPPAGGEEVKVAPEVVGAPEIPGVKPGVTPPPTEDAPTAPGVPPTAPTAPMDRKTQLQNIINEATTNISQYEINQRMKAPVGKRSIAEIAKGVVPATTEESRIYEQTVKSRQAAQAELLKIESTEKAKQTVGKVVSGVKTGVKGFFERGKELAEQRRLVEEEARRKKEAENVAATKQPRPGSEFFTKPRF